MGILNEIYLSFYKKHWKLYVIYLFTLISVPLKQISIPHFYGKIIEAINNSKLEKGAKLMFFLLLIWIVIQSINLLEGWVNSQIWPRFAAFSKEKVLGKIFDRYNTSFQELKTGELLTKLIKLPYIFDDMQDYVMDFFLDNLIVIISNVAYLFYHSKYLGGVYLISISVFSLLGYKFVKTCTGFKKEIEEHHDYTHGVIEDTLSNLISVYTSKQTSNEKKRIKHENEILIKKEIKRQMCNLKFKIMFSILNVLIFIGLNYTAFKLYKNKKVSIGSLTAIFILNFNILNSLLMFYRNFRNFSGIQGNIKYINEFYKNLPDYVPISSQLIKNVSEGIDIELKNINYSYKDPNELFYENFNLKIPMNQSVVIMGGIGSGKSTFAKLLVGLQKPISGDIYLNGVNANNLNINNIRSNIIYIPQSPNLFDRTLWENISYGVQIESKNKTLNTIYNLMEKMELTEIKDIFMEKMDYSVGKKGSFLSGGQRQIVWILRALLSKAKVIILDEPTSALDIKSKEQIKKLIHFLTKDRTLIIITHDLDLTENMSRLIVFDNGKILKDKSLQVN